MRGLLLFCTSVASRLRVAPQSGGLADEGDKLKSTNSTKTTVGANMFIRELFKQWTDSDQESFFTLWKYRSSQSSRCRTNGCPAPRNGSLTHHNCEPTNNIKVRGRGLRRYKNVERPQNRRCEALTCRSLQSKCWWFSTGWGWCSQRERSNSWNCWRDCTAECAERTWQNTDRSAKRWDIEQWAR